MYEKIRFWYENPRGTSRIFKDHGNPVKKLMQFNNQPDFTTVRLNQHSKMASKFHSLWNVELTR